MKLIACGDSWTKGTDLLDPNYIHKSHFIQENIDYRDKNRFVKILADKLDISEVVDLSMQGGSNDRILRKLMDYVINVERTDDIFVVITWTSPERTEFCSFENTMDSFADDGFISVGPWLMFNRYVGDKELANFFTTFHKYFWNQHEMLDRYLQILYLTQMFLKFKNIKYVMNQAFVINECHNTLIDKPIQDVIDELPKNIYWPRQKIFNDIDKVNFMNIHSTLYLYLSSIAGNLIKNAHPTLEGHKLIADHIYQYIKGKKIL